MPEKHVKILCHVEHLHPADVTAPAELAFGMTLSVAISDGFRREEIPTIQPLLQPWRLKILAMKVVTQSGKVITPDPTVVQQVWQSKAVSEYRALLAARLEQEFISCQKFFPEAFEWSTIGQSYDHPTDSDGKARFNRPWHVVLAQAATWPTPFPQALNLSLIFRFPFPDQEPLFVVPIFELAGTPFTPKADSFRDFEVDTGKRQSDSTDPDTKKVKVCDYDKQLTGAIPIRAYVDSCEVRKPSDTKGSLLDLYTYWIDPLTDFDKFDEDWRAQIEARMANAFDLSRRIIEYLRPLSLLPSPDANAIEEARVGADLAISALRDLTGIGITAGPNRQSLLERLLPQVRKGYQLDAARIELVRKAAQSKFSNDSRPSARAATTGNVTIANPGTASFDGVTLIRGDVLFVRAQTMAAENGLYAFNSPDSALTRISQMDEWAELPNALFTVREGSTFANTRWLCTNERGGTLNVTAISFQQVNTLDWRGVIRATIPATAGLKLVSDSKAALSPGKIVAELDQLFHLVFEPANLWSLVRYQWSMLKTELGLDDQEIEKLAKLVDPAEPLDSNDAGRMDLRRQLAYENLGVFWRSFVRSKLRDTDRKPLLKQSFACYLRAYCLLRFGKGLAAMAAGPQMPGDLDCVDAKATMDRSQLEKRYHELRVSPLAPDPNDQAICDRILPRLLADIKTWTDTFDQTLVNNPVPVATPGAKLAPRKSSTPHSVTLAVDAIDGEPNGADPLSSISGVGVLMREPGKEWRCLNLAVPELAAESGPVSLTTDPVLVPLRLSYRNELRQALINYSNHPLAARSPAAQLTAYHPLASPETPTLASMLTYRFSSDPRAKLPALKFGRKYEYLPFIIGNCGVLPELLAKGGNALCEFDVAKVDASKLQDKIRTFDYQRSAPIGSIRVLDVDGKACVQLPPIADDVCPRARDMIIDPPSPNETPDTIPSINSAPRTLVLLSPEPGWKNSVNDFNFTLRLPATDIVTWDRWIGAGAVHGTQKTEEEVRTLRVNIWTEYHKRLDLGATTSTTCELPVADHDASLDDPALSHQFWFELQEELGNAKSGAPRTLPVAVGHNLGLTTLPLDPAAAYGTSMRPAQSDRVNVKITGVRANPASMEGTAGGINIRVTKGKVYRLRISCCLPVSALQANPVIPFADIWDTKLEEVLIGGQRFYKVAPYEMLVEVATECLGINDTACTVTAELNSLEVSGPDEVNRNRPLKVLFPPTGSPGLPYVHRVELQRQMWRWLGRETAAHPGAPPFDEWEAREFGSRSDNDYLAVPMQAKLTNAGDGSRAFEFTEYLSGPNAKKEDLRALHYRFKARATSRYAGMLPEPEAESLSWKSCFVPCRVLEQPPPPSIKLILPLTESFGSSGTSNTAGLLLVLRGPWHEIGGIGENIEAEVVSVKYGGHSYYEFGADPILSGVGEVPDQSLNLKDGIRGPIGHTFDRVLDAALFTSTSFIIPAPQIKGAQHDFSWNFCKLRFRRVIKVNQGLQLNSVFTEPVWVQYLPEFFLTDLGAIKFENLRLNLKNGNLSVADATSGKTAGLEPQKAPSSNAVFELYLVLTRRVFDATGRHDEEEYLGLYYRQGDEWIRAKSNEPRPDLGVSDRLLARIIEVQRRVSNDSGFTQEDAFWNALFDRSGTITDGKRARIVRISEPILSAAAARPKC